MRKSRTFWIRSLKIFALLLPVVLFILFLPVNNSEDTRRIRDFYREEPNSLDVVLLGSSDVYTGFSSVLAYEEFGFTSFPYVYASNYIGLIPYQMEDVFLVQSPKLLVIEITEAMNARPDTYDFRLRQYIAGIPSWQRRHQLIQALGDREEGLLSYYFPFSLHHGSATPGVLWENAQRERMVSQRGYSLLKGVRTYTANGSEAEQPPINTTGDFSGATPLPHVTENFTALLEYCRSEGIENILFVSFPHRIVNETVQIRHREFNAVGQLIESYGYDFINLENHLDDLDIHLEDDFLDDEHLNLYGQYKVTRYLSRYICENYDLGESQLSEEGHLRWQECVEYQHLYYTAFDEGFRAAKAGAEPEWMEEDARFLKILEGMKK